MMRLTRRHLSAHHHRKRRCHDRIAALKHPRMLLNGSNHLVSALSRIHGIDPIIEKAEVRLRYRIPNCRTFGIHQKNP